MSFFVSIGYTQKRPMVIDPWLIFKLFHKLIDYVKQICKNNVQALKYPSAYAVTLYMPGFKAINWK